MTSWSPDACNRSNSSHRILSESYRTPWRSEHWPCSHKSIPGRVRSSVL
jgi:hypothetical protein